LPLEGYLKGYIDMVYVHDQRWYVVDYKTNHLGDDVSDYGRDQLQQAMAHGHYYLQSHLYALALHRHLTRTLLGYEFKRHFGGIQYLFIKGMIPESHDTGVFFERPPLARLMALSDLLERPPLTTEDK
jgi:exodeoxyribonuclease V beta subunit